MAKIAACMIVKNSVETIERTLDSIRLHVDEINIYDTGSTDGTVELLERIAGAKFQIVRDGVLVNEYKALDEGAAENEQLAPLAPIRVKQGEWRDDFSWAREQSFAMASKEVDWFFWLDDDDVIVGAENLRGLAANAHAPLDGYAMLYEYAHDDQGTCVCQLWRERLLRRREGWSWRFPVHEVWLADEDSGIVPTMMFTPPELVRFIHRRPEDRYGPTRNLDLLLLHVERLKERDEEPDLRTKAYVGTELTANLRVDEAIPWFVAYLDDPRSRPGDERSQVQHRMAQCMRARGDAMAATEIEFRAVMERDDWTENLVGLAECFAMQGDWARAETWARRALETGIPQTMLIIDPTYCTVVPMLILVDASAAQEKFEQAHSWLEKATAAAPGSDLVKMRAEAVQSAEFVSSTVRAVLSLRETLIRHDENLKALHLLENVPYSVAEHPAIVEALRATRENCRHAIDPKEYKRWYEDEPKESTITDEMVAVVGQRIERAGFLLETCRTFEKLYGRKPRVLDMGANDFWMSCFLWTEGEFVCDGIELNKASAEKGIERGKRFGTPARLRQGDILNGTSIFKGERYDIISMFEVFEHVPDVDKTLAALERMLAPDGIICLTTPNGAWEGANLPFWHVVERKGHLRAMPTHEFAGKLLERGEVVSLNVHDYGRLTWIAYKPKRKKGRVHIFAGGSWESWTPEDVKKKGMGGSETALVYLSLGLAQEGYDVRVFSGAEPGLYGQSLWRPASAFNPSDDADVLIVSRLPHVFDVPLNAPIRMLWCHDAGYEMTSAQLGAMTHVVCLSEWQKAKFEQEHPDARGKITILRNGLGYRGGDGQVRFPDGERSFGERKPRAVYSSSADRGLDELLYVWPTIRERVPDAELHVFYGFDILEQVAKLNPGLLSIRDTCLELAERAGGEDGGVFLRGRKGQDELYDEFQQARVWTYPTAFTETSCITAMEARSAGLAIVTSDLAALHETVGDHGVLIAAPHTSDEYREEFVDHVVRALTDESYWATLHHTARRNVEQLDWRFRVKDWTSVIEASRVAAKHRG